MLTACGVPEAGLAPAEESLGTWQSALCYGVSVSSLTVDGVSTYQGVMAGAGGFAVAGGANAIRLEYYSDGVLKYYEERTGTSGSWNYSYGGVPCGTHNFQVKAYPMIVDSAGTRTTCSSSPTSSAVHDASEACPVTYTWQRIGTESCYDLFMDSCYSHYFSPSCPSSPAGKTCSSPGSTCWYVRSSSYVDEYSCQ
jgi:hypothetical protein